jgi:hypothetical protein
MSDTKDDTKGVLERLAEEVARAMSFAKEVAGNISEEPLDFIYFIRSMGWDIPVTPSQINSVRNSSLDFINCAVNLVTALNKDPIDYGSLPSLIIEFSEKVGTVSSQLQLELAPEWEPVDFLKEFGDHFPQQLIDYFILNYLQLYYPKIYSVLSLVGLFETRYQPPQPPYRTGYLQYAIKWDRLKTLFSKPQDLPGQIFGWGTPSFESDHLFSLLQFCAVSFQVPAHVIISEPKVLSTNVNTVSAQKLSLCIPFIEQEDVEAGLLLYPILANNTVGDNAGLALSPYLIGQVNEEFELAENLYLKITSGLKLDKSMGITLRPASGGQDLELDYFVLNPLDTASGGIQVSVMYKRPEKTVLLGDPQASRFEIGGIGLRLNGDIQTKDIGLGLKVDGASIVIAKGDGDGFIQKILPSEPIILNLDCLIGISSKRGFYFEGGAGLEYTIYVNQQLGPILFSTIDLKLDFKDGEIALITAVSASAALGPVQAAVSKIGLKTALEIGKKGMLGDADLNFSFKPPSGIGLAIDASVVKGGGFLSIEDGEYAGIIYIDVVKKVAITVIGILNTKLPDGKKTFSLKMFGMAEFPPIQLSMGFILTGVGLAVAINCTMNTEVLRNCVYTGSLTSLMFPPDPIKNARKIIADLKSFFPPKEDCFVFGAMVKIGWGGAVPLIEIAAGIFIEIANSSIARIALAGILKCLLPQKESPVLKLQMQIIGIIDFTESTLSIDASIVDSSLLQFNLGGDMALRACWGENSRFAMSAGGFYPGYRAPTGFPVLKRMSISLGTDNPRVGLFMYLAVAENSVQFGALFLLHFQKDLSMLGFFELDGQLGFDVLFHFNPFYFETHFYASLSLKRDGDEFCGISLDLMLSGPNNYQAKGFAKFKVCGFSKKIEFDETFGDKQAELPQEVISPFLALQGELAKPLNWEVVTPTWGNNLVKFRSSEKTSKYLDTFGGLRFRQKALPLTFTLQKFGSAAIPAGEDYFDLAPQEDPAALEVMDSFASGSYRKLSDEEQVSAIPFEKIKSGFEFSGHRVEVTGTPQSVVHYGQTIGYEDVYIQVKDPESEQGGIHIPDNAKDGRFNDTEIMVDGKSQSVTRRRKIVKPEHLEDWQRMAGQRYHNPQKIKPASGMANRITVSEQQFTVVGSEARDGKFQRVAVDGCQRTVQGTSYAQAKQKQPKNQDVSVIGTYKAG